ncbi:conserved hypothetical protein [Mesorhizobium prunaredense]|uniref:Methyl-accepting chemotaxis protein n=1 Tax=Mesorhizobium prunaredense TaxID=1631249 RepID=A0A1R3VG25_9HYPH|nr:hypothetical protein [Mesorhizobium prunaredense]SIT58788.1 conserved hypothetical protein [Mesorhizobium prunaredense]
MNGTSPTGWKKPELWSFRLSVASLVISTLMTAGLFYYGQQFAQLSADRSRLEKVQDKKIELWDRIGPQLNRILSYITYVGRWNQISAAQVVDAKRASDEIFYVYKPFFSDKFQKDYNRFMDSAFQTFNGMGEDAKIRTSPTSRKDDVKAFADSYDLQVTFDAYNALLAGAVDEFGLSFAAPKFKSFAPEGVPDKVTVTQSK